MYTISHVAGVHLVIPEREICCDGVVKLNLAGYKFDEHERDSVSLKLQFSRNPGARSGGGHRGKR